MRRYLTVFLAILFIAGCSAKPKPKDVLAKVNNYEISGEEFEEAFRNSAAFKNDTLDSRKAYLDTLINQKLVLQEAQKNNLDKEKGFLKTIERFWEQALLRIAVGKKMLDISGSVQVSDEEARLAYDRLPQAEKAGKDQKELSDKIKWQLKKEKETKKFESWLAELRKKADISVNYGLLKKHK